MAISFLDVLDRAHNGPFCTEKEWDTKVIPGGIAKVLKKYDLKGTCNPENPINCDDSLADAFWEGGLELAVDVGMLCTSTERVIKFSREEILFDLRETPDHWHAGIGLDACDWKARKPDDPCPPATVFGAFGTIIDEDLFIPVMQSHCQNRSVDGTITGSLATVYGRELRTGTPYETLGGALEARLTQETLERAGRPGMFVLFPLTAPLEYGVFGAVGVPGGPSLAQTRSTALCPSELKTDYHILQKVGYHLIRHAVPSAGHWSIIGGYAGGPEGCAVAAVAASILLQLVNRARGVAGGVYDSRYLGNTGRDAIWAHGVSRQAVSRNTHILTTFMVNPVSGPLTETLLREITVCVLCGAVSGASAVGGIRTAGGKFPNRTSGVETGYAGEVTKAAAGMAREEANGIAKQLLPKYEDELKRPNIGVAFPECFDVRTVKPTKEWEDIYKKIKKEVAQLGVSFPRFE